MAVNQHSNLTWIKGYEHRYAINTLGRIYSAVSNRWLSKTRTNSVYLQCRLDNKTFRIHRLVALTFIPNPLNLPEVNHKDENKHNNDVSNLEWVTSAENMQHSHGKTITLMYKGIPIVITNIAQFARNNGLNRAHLTAVYTGKRKSHKGYTLWR